MLSTVDGLVIRSQNYGDNDKLVTILTAEGKQTVLAKGARSMKSKIKNITEPFVSAIMCVEIKRVAFSSKFFSIVCKI